LNKIKKTTETLTKAICNKGFRGNASILPRIKFGVTGQESSPQSLTAYSLDRFTMSLGGRNPLNAFMIAILYDFIF